MSTLASAISLRLSRTARGVTIKERNRKDVREGRGGGHEQDGKRCARSKREKEDEDERERATGHSDRNLEKERGGSQSVGIYERARGRKKGSQCDAMWSDEWRSARGGEAPERVCVRACGGVVEELWIRMMIRFCGRRGRSGKSERGRGEREAGEAGARGQREEQGHCRSWPREDLLPVEDLWAEGREKEGGEGRGKAVSVQLVLIASVDFEQTK